MRVPRDVLRDLVRHMEWADARVWHATPATEPDDARLKLLLGHIHVVQRAFLTIWTRGDVGLVLQKGEQLASLAEIRQWAQPYYGEAHAFLDSVSDAELAEIVEMPWAQQIADYLGHRPGPTTVAETMFQVTSHSTYHRGQVNTRLRELNVTPPLVDYIAWLWGNRPAAEWRT
jgi:uncharacterized damage-inducible protein DinB